MSRHVPRSERWASHGTDEHRSTQGQRVRRSKGEWWALVAYELLVEEQDAPPHWEARYDRIGPFRRPRNAMVEAERHTAALRNHHGERVRLVEAGGRDAQG